jgi:hypothetical protein
MQWSTARSERAMADEKKRGPIRRREKCGMPMLGVFPRR